MNAVKRVEIKNRHLSHFARLINILDFNPKKLDIQIKGNDDIGIYYVQYDSKPLYLVVVNISGYFEENDGNMYLNSVSCNEFGDLTYLKYKKVWEEIKYSITYFATDKFSDDDDKDYRVIMFNTDDSLPLNKTIKIKSLTIIIRSILKRDGGYYPQIFLDDCLYD